MIVLDFVAIIFVFLVTISNLPRKEVKFEILKSVNYIISLIDMFYQYSLYYSTKQIIQIEDIVCSHMKVWGSVTVFLICVLLKMSYLIKDMTFYLRIKCSFILIPLSLSHVLSFLFIIETTCNFNSVLNCYFYIQFFNIFTM